MSVGKALEFRNQYFEGVMTCQANDSLLQVMEKIVKAEVHRLVVVDEDDHVDGIVSLSDILTFLVLTPLGKRFTFPCGLYYQPGLPVVPSIVPSFLVSLFFRLLLRSLFVRLLLRYLFVRSFASASSHFFPLLSANDDQHDDLRQGSKDLRHGPTIRERRRRTERTELWKKSPSWRQQQTLTASKLSKPNENVSGTTVSTVNERSRKAARAN